MSGFYSSVERGALGDDGLPNYVYYNATVINTSSGVDSTGKDRADPQVRFNETRDVPIIENTDRYDMSIVRFTLDGPNKDLPLFIPRIRTGTDNPTNDVDLTAYSITLTCVLKFNDGFNTYTSPELISQQFIKYIPETKDQFFAPKPQPSTCQTGQDISTRYYWVYTYSHWLDLMDNAFVAAIADLDAQGAAWWGTTGSPAPYPGISTQPPEMLYNPTTNLFSIYADAYGFSSEGYYGSKGTATDQQFKLYFNANTFGLFCNFQNEYDNLDLGRTNEIIIYSALWQNRVNITPPAPLASWTAWVITQDYPSTSTLWSPCESIVFTTTLLPVLNESSADPVRFGDDNIGNSASSRPAFNPILTDIALPKSSAADYRQFIEYIPSAEYRMISLTNGSPVTSLDIQVWWKNRLDGQLYPLQMFNLSTVTFKIMFRKKGIVG